jgi:hypothetical protein
MAFHFDPAPQLNLEERLRVEVFVPIHLVHRFHPSIEPVSSPPHFNDLMISGRNPHGALRPTALKIAEVVSNAMFGSTEAIREDFQISSWWETDNTLGAIFFYLNHRLGMDDVGLNPELIRVYAQEDEGGRLVLKPSVVTGERRKRYNDEAEGVWDSEPES